MGKRVPKRDRFGLFAQAEQEVLLAFKLSIKAALLPAGEKQPIIKDVRISIDTAKRLVRLCQELGIIEEKMYFSIQEKLIEASKMAAGWLVYMEKRKEPRTR